MAALGGQWRELHAASPTSSVFMSWEWQSAWWTHYGAGQPLRILVAREGNRVSGILPLYVRREQLWGRRASVLQLVGTGGDTHPDDLGPVLAEGREEAVSRQLADFLVQSVPGWDVLLATDVPADSPFPPALAEAAKRERLAVTCGTSARIVYTTLPSSWEEYLRTLSRERRWRLRNTRRKLEDSGDTKFFVWEDAADVDRAVDRLAELHRKRWTAAGQPHGFSSRQYVEFHRQAIKGCLARGWLRLYCLELAGELVAMYYCYRFRNRVFLMQGGFDPAHAKVKPGNALLGFALEHAIGEGNQAFDFLRGEHRYKEELATSERKTEFVTVYRRTSSARMRRALRETFPAAKSQVKSLLIRFGLLKKAPSH